MRKWCIPRRGGAESAPYCSPPQATPEVSLDLVAVGTVVDEEGEDVLDESGEPRFMCAIIQNTPAPHWVLSKNALRNILTRAGENEKRTLAFKYKRKTYPYWNLTLAEAEDDAGWARRAKRSRRDEATEEEEGVDAPRTVVDPVASELRVRQPAAR